MGRPPAYIFIVRHGNRLDAADKLWHITSPTPYDPPLTYGGWTQARAIGQRIADILRENAAPVETPSSDTDQPAGTKKRRYKVVIHSSPFLRCLQTSIAVGAGIASDGQPLEAPRPAPDALQLRTPNAKSPVEARVKGKKEGKAQNSKDKDSLHKSVMRVDAFLGEWLSPDYFELITPPPNSATMVTVAKAELLRREDYSSFIHHHQAHAHTHAHAHSHSTGHLWNASRSNTWSSNQLAGQDELPKSGSQPISPPGLFGSAANRRGSSSSYKREDKDKNKDAAGGTRLITTRSTGYVPPTPNFALSHQAPAPAGYVAHARDHCIQVDYQWDSMRPPYDWGDGGEFGEEWTSMHRRFRTGLQKLVDWYATTPAPYEMVTQTVQFKAHSTHSTHSAQSSDYAIDSDDEAAADDDDDDDYVNETVVVLVSHGAGCNALIGAITQEPVLMDVGLASLSVAVRKPGMTRVPTAAEREADKKSDAVVAKGGGKTTQTRGLIPLHRYYEMKLFANSDHLRSTPTTPTVSSPGAGVGFGGLSSTAAAGSAAGRGSSMAMVMGSGATRSRHANSLSGTLGNLAYLDNGGALPGAADAVPVRRSMSTASRAYRSRTPGTGVESTPTPTPTPSGGITIGSGVTHFLSSPAAASAAAAAATSGTTTSQSGNRGDGASGSNTDRPRTGSFGLWSPVIRPRDALTDLGSTKKRSGSGGGGGHGLGLGLHLAKTSTSGGPSSSSVFAAGDGADDDDAIEDDDDMEILLSFPAEKATEKTATTTETEKSASAADTKNNHQKEENTTGTPTTTTPPTRAAASPGIAPLSLSLSPAVTPSSVLPALPRRLVGLHIGTPDSDDSDDDGGGGSRVPVPPPRSTPVAATATSTIQRRAAEPSPTPSTGSSNNGLWSSPFSDSGPGSRL